MRRATHTLRKLASLTPALVVAFLTTLVAPPPVADAQSTILWVGDQSGCAGNANNPSTGSWFDGLNWLNFISPSNGDEAILQVAIPGQGSFTFPHTIHFGNFCKRLFGCSDVSIPGGDAVVQTLRVKDANDWVFDFASGFTPGCSPTPRPLQGSLTVTGDTFVGFNSSDAALTLRNGAVSTDSLNLGTSEATGSLTIEAGAGLTVRRFVVGDGLGSDGSVTVTNAAVTMTGADPSTVVGLRSSAGSVTVSGQDAMWTDDNFMSIGEANGSGAFIVILGATLQSAFVRIGDNSGVGIITISDPGSTWTSTEVVDVATGGDGTLDILNGAVVSHPSASIGQFDSAHGSVLVSGSGSHWNITDNLTNFWFGANTTGELEIADLGVVTAGSYTQNPPGTLRIQLSPSGAGQLQVAGNASFSGTLDITLADGFSPSLGDSFDIVTYGSHTGQFDTIAGTILPDGGVLVVSYTPSAMVVFRPNPDLNNDGDVNSDDLGLLIEQWGASGQADFDGDGAVDGPDIAFLLANWGPAP